MSVIFKPEYNPTDSLWYVTVADPGGKETKHQFADEDDGNKFIIDELADYVDTGMTRSQQAFVLSNWDKMPLDKLTALTFDTPGA